ncbi:MAG: extracellular solute-binding protein [Butyrivibrio sp.]|nr:extracellular solute-binding protein [Butyrivibrio sp.]
MKTRFWVFLILLSLISSLVACNKSGNDTALQDASDAEKKTIVVAARSGTQAKVIENVKSDFEKDNNCIVEVVPMEAEELYNSVVIDSTNETAYYDLCMIDDPNMPLYMQTGVLLNLTAQGYKDDSDFLEKCMNLGKNPYALGATYAVPFNGNVQLLFYNESLLNELGYSEITSWQDVLEMSRAAAAKGKKGFMIRGQSGNPIVSDFLPILWAFGGEIMDDENTILIDSGESRKALEFYLELLETGENADKEAIVESITNGDALFALGWPSWFIDADGAKASYVQIPGCEAEGMHENATGEIGNWLMGVTVNSGKKELAIRLLEYLTSADVQQNSIENGGIPTRKSILKNTKLREQYPYFETIYEGTQNSRVRPRTVKWSEIEKVFGAQLYHCIKGDKTVDETITDSQKELEELMKDVIN